VSLSWPESLRLAIGESRVDVVRTGWRGAVRESCSVEHAPGARNEAIAASLSSALGQVRGARKACSIVLGNGLVRYAMLPWRSEVAQKAARHAYAQAFLENTYGTAAQSWAVMLDESAYGEPTLACAVDRELLESVRGTLREAGRRAISIQPYFCAALNRYRRKMTGLDLWFAVLEPERICLAQIAGRSLRVLRSQRACGDASAELAGMIERESLVAGRAISDARLYVFAPGATAESFMSLQQLDAETYLLPFAGDARYAMALA
jgi:hypothetical protein